ncbi:MAG: hypothetical protein Q4C30_08375 [Bacteroidia bacterium]|nr:hypothetical protein [Bacteroidia bacterium]
MAKPKPRVIKNFEKLDEAMKEEILALHPDLKNDIRTYDIGGGRLMSALPYETEEFCYLIKFPAKEEMDIDDEPIGGDDEMNLEGGVDADDEEEEDDVETSAGSLQDMADAEDED